MSPDLRKALHDAAPEPARQLDAEALARRGRSLRARSVVLKGSLSVMLGLGIWAASSAFQTPADVPIGPERQNGVDGSESKEATPVPEGEPHVVIEGTFEEGDRWGRYAGRRWRVIASVSDDGTECWTLRVGTGSLDIGGTACTNAGLSFQRPIGGRHYLPGGEFGNDVAIVVGQARPDVALMRFEFSGYNTQTVFGEPVEPPAGAGGSWNYYIAFLPADQNGIVVALDTRNEELQRDQLCELDCKESEFQAADGAERIPASDGPISTGGYVFKDLFFMAGGRFDPTTGTDHISLHGHIGLEDGFPGQKICTWTVYDAEGDEIGSARSAFTALGPSRGTIKDTLVVTGWPHRIEIDCSG